jgi:hypothetical protein
MPSNNQILIACILFFIIPIMLNYIINCIDQKQMIKFAERMHSVPPNVDLHKKLIIIIPYRNRKKSLNFILPKLKTYLNYYKTKYIIILSELRKDVNWNKGICINAAFKYAETITDATWKYLLIMDVDIIPKHKLTIAFKGYDKIYHPYGYRHCLGGMVFIPKKVFKDCNGFSNLYYNWGYEDSDFQKRCISKKYSIIREASKIFKRYNKYWHDINFDENIEKSMNKNKKLFMTRNYPTDISNDGLTTLGKNYELLSIKDNNHHILCDDI